MIFHPARKLVAPTTEKTVPASPAVVFIAVDERAIMSKEFPSESALIADMKATFPGLMARPVREFRLQGFNHGVWTGGPGNMPDGLPIFDPLQHGCDDGYDGGVHEGFTAWLEARGWYLENYDGSAYLAIPIMQARQLGDAWAEYEKSSPNRQSLADNESPF